MKVFLKTHILLSMVTDCQYLFDVIKKAICTTEKKVVIDCQSVKNAFKSLGPTTLLLLNLSLILQMLFQSLRQV